MSEFEGAQSAESGEQTRRSFGDKWANNSRLLFESEDMISSGSLAWIIERNGFDDLESFGSWVETHNRILDAGCGNGRVTAVLSRLASPAAEVVGVDINPTVAMENLAGYPNATVLEGDLTGDLGFLGQFDLIYCQEVLHHTQNPAGAFGSLARQLRPGGELAVYVYKVKAPVREFVDDYVRSRVSVLPYQQAIAEMRAITELGRILAELDMRIDIPEVPSLGIERGTYDVQRFFYHFFMKCFWNDNMTFEDNMAINYDWYHPSIATRHTLDEVLSWFASAGLTAIHSRVDHYGVTVRGRRPV